MNLRCYAQMQPCLVRLPGICNHDRSTVVLAHVRLAGVTGVGMKAADFLGAHACSACHDAVDSNNGDDAIQRAFLEGVIRTQAVLIGAGILRCDAKKAQS